MPVLPSYRNQSTDLQSKSTDWFLYEATQAFNGSMPPFSVMEFSKALLTNTIFETRGLSKPYKNSTLPVYVEQTNSGHGHLKLHL